MSSVFLYVAIVAIWAFVLVPRWLRRAHPAPQADIDQDYDDETGLDWEAEDDVDGAVDEAAAPERYPVAPLSADRSRVLKARRRLLTMITLLTIAAGACTALKLTSWWTCIPPIGMLGMYLLLLREAALADAEQARRRAALELRDQAVRQRAHQDYAETEEEPERSAQIIDISARVGDQLYDQYADATVRAVGD